MRQYAMNPDRIRKAVELADGWSIEGELIKSHPGWPQIRTLEGYGCPLASPDRCILDALRCQLERQVESAGAFVHQYNGYVVIVKRGEKEDVYLATAKGPNRTENTINAILDSGVLEP